VTASLAELQPVADQLLELLGSRIGNGSLVLDFEQGQLRCCRTTNVYRPRSKNPLDRLESSSHTERHEVPGAVSVRRP
jgi:hypothetical protein